MKPVHDMAVDITSAKTGQRCSLPWHRMSSHQWLFHDPSRRCLSILQFWNWRLRCLHRLFESPSKWISFLCKYMKLIHQPIIHARLQKWCSPILKDMKNFFIWKKIHLHLTKFVAKIVLFRRYDPPSSPQGNYLDFKDNAIFTSNTTIVARIQDCYHVSTLFDRITKWNSVLTLLNETIENKDENKLFINFASGTSSLCFPDEVAYYVTPKVGYFLEVTEPNAFVGIILFDFIDINYNDI